MKICSAKFYGRVYFIGDYMQDEIDIAVTDVTEE